MKSTSPEPEPAPEKFIGAYAYETPGTQDDRLFSAVTALRDLQVEDFPLALRAAAENARKAATNDQTQKIWLQIAQALESAAEKILTPLPPWPLTAAAVLEDALRWDATCRGALDWLYSLPQDQPCPEPPDPLWVAWFALNAGQKWPDSMRIPHAATLIAMVCRDSMYACEAGICWPDSIRLPHAAQLVAAVCLQPEQAYVAGLCWPDSMRIPHAQQLADSVCRSCWRAYDAGQSWPNTLRLVHAEQLVKAVCRELWPTRLAGQFWPDTLRLPHAAALVASIRRDPKQEQMARDKWPLAMFA